MNAKVRQLIPIVHSTEQTCAVSVNVADAIAASEELQASQDPACRRLAEQLRAAAELEMAGEPVAPGAAHEKLNELFTSVRASVESAGKVAS